MGLSTRFQSVRQLCFSSETTRSSFAISGCSDLALRLSSHLEVLDEPQASRCLGLQVSSYEKYDVHICILVHTDIDRDRESRDRHIHIYIYIYVLHIYTYEYLCTYFGA